MAALKRASRVYRRPLYYRSFAEERTASLLRWYASCLSSLFRHRKSLPHMSVIFSHEHIFPAYVEDSPKERSHRLLEDLVHQQYSCYTNHTTLASEEVLKPQSRLYLSCRNTTMRLISPHKIPTSVLFCSRRHIRYVLLAQGMIVIIMILAP